MKKQHHTDLLSACGLLCLFLLTAAAALAAGVCTWQSASDAMQAGFQYQTPLAYLEGQARQADTRRVERFADGTEALALDSEIEGDAYVTRLYCYDGALYQLFTPADVQLTPQDGVRLVETETLSLQETDGVIRVTIQTADGSTQTLLLAVRGGEGTA